MCIRDRPDTSHAQVTPPITSSGLNTHISKPSGNSLQYDITAGTRAGTNLFHSFGDFSVPTNNIANFLNDSGLATSNILGRVTGGNPSHIFGTLQTTGFGGANLFLMNPAGIVFGPNAALNVGLSLIHIYRTRRVSNLPPATHRAQKINGFRVPIQVPFPRLWHMLSLIHI